MVAFCQSQYITSVSGYLDFGGSEFRNELYLNTFILLVI